MNAILKHRLLKPIANTITYIIMVLVNIFAEILKLNKLTTAEISNKYQNVLTPAGFTFIIWGVIYLLLGYFLYLQWLAYLKKEDIVAERIGYYFMISNLLNTLWVILWHYEWLFTTVLLTAGMLYCLFKIATLIPLNYKKHQHFFEKIAFSVYFGWLSIAMLANMTVWLTSLTKNGFSLFLIVFSIIGVLLVSSFALLMMIENKDKFYILVIIWALLGLIVNRFSDPSKNILIISILMIVFLGLLGIYGFSIYRLWQQHQKIEEA